MNELPATGTTHRRSTRGVSLVGAIFLVAILSSCAGSDQESPRSGTGYKIGNPYQIKGLWYHPEVDYQYSETGIASWYGPNFHGERTANGEIFDMNKVSAAHRTLPLPSIVRVTNLDNGRSLKMRVNDRGPFAQGRIIDVSRRSAQLLGFYREGTARVRVDIVADESRRLAAGDARAPEPPLAEVETPGPARSAGDDITRQALAPLGGSDQAMATTEGSIIPIRATSPSQFYVQAGAFSQYDNADRLRSRLAGLGPVEIHPFQIGGRNLYRVWLGPLSSDSEADRLLSEAVRAGYPESHIVFE